MTKLKLAVNLAAACAAIIGIVTVASWIWDDVAKLRSMHRYSSVTANELVYTNVVTFDSKDLRQGDTHGVSGMVEFDPINNPSQAHQRRHADANLGWQFGCAYALGATNLSLDYLSNAIDRLSGSTNGCPVFKE